MAAEKWKRIFIFIPNFSVSNLMELSWINKHFIWRRKLRKKANFLSWFPQMKKIASPSFSVSFVRVETVWHCRPWFLALDLLICTWQAISCLYAKKRALVGRAMLRNLVWKGGNAVLRKVNLSKKPAFNQEWRGGGLVHKMSKIDVEKGGAAARRRLHSACRRGSTKPLSLCYSLCYKRVPRSNRKGYLVQIGRGT